MAKSTITIKFILLLETKLKRSLKCMARVGFDPLTSGNGFSYIKKLNLS